MTHYEAAKFLKEKFRPCVFGQWSEALEVAIGVLERRCNTCSHYDGVHNAHGHAPCKFWNIGAVMWDDYCKRWKSYGKVQ